MKHGAWEEVEMVKWESCVAQTCQPSHSWLIKHRICLRKATGGMVPVQLLTVMSCWCVGAPSLQCDVLLCQTMRWFGQEPSLLVWFASCLAKLESGGV